VNIVLNKKTIAKDFIDFEKRINGVITCRILIEEGHEAKLAQIPNDLWKTSNLKRLELSGLGITKIPDDIVGLQTIQELSILGVKGIESYEILTQFGRLQYLNLTDNNLKHIPKAIYVLTNLKNLILGESKRSHFHSTRKRYSINKGLNNHIVELGEDIVKLESLESLNLAFNDLETIPKRLKELKFLRDLDLEWNNIKTIPDEFCEIKNLTNLNLKNNELTKLPSSFGKLSKLRKVQIDNNPIIELPESIIKLNHNEFKISGLNLKSLPGIFGEWNRLEKLEIHNCPLDTLPDNFGFLTNLKILTIKNCKLKTLPSTFSNLRRLQQLNLNNNKFRNVPETIFSLINLKSLDIENNGITEIGEGIHKMQGLEVLDIKNNALTTLPKSIGRLVNLRKFSVTRNRIAEFPIEMVGLANLEVLNCGLNPLKFPPYDIAMRGANTTIQFLREKYDQNKETIFLRLKEELELFKTGLHQYLLYFKDYLKNIKGIKVDFSIISLPDGFELEFNTDKIEDIKRVGQFLQEYVGYIKENVDSIVPHFEEDDDLNKVNQKLAIIELRSQLRNLQTTIEIKNARVQQLEEQTTFYKDRIFSLEQISNNLIDLVKNQQPIITLNNQNVLAQRSEISSISKTDIENLIDPLVNRMREIQSYSIDTNDKIESLYLLLNDLKISDEATYHQQVKDWLVDWEKCESNSLDYLISGEFLFENLDKANAKDFSPFILQYCRVVENELKEKIFVPYKSTLTSRYSGVDLSNFLQWDSKNNKDFANAIKKTNYKFMLGKMNSFLATIKDSNLIANSSLVLDFKGFIETNFNDFDQLILQTNFLQELELLRTDYRNTAAHPQINSILERGEGIDCRNLARNLILNLIGTVK